MANGLEYGLKITGDGKLAIAAIKAVDKAIDSLDKREKAFLKTSQNQAKATDKSSQAIRLLAKETQTASGKIASLERQSRIQTRAVLAAAKANRDAARAIAAGTAAKERDTAAGRRLHQQNQAITASTHNVASAMRLVSGISLLYVTGQAIGLTDAWTLMEGRMALVVNTGQDVGSVMDDLHDRAQEARAEYGSFNKVYFRTARALSSYIQLSDKAAQTTTNLAKSTRISGASTQESAAGLLQLSQGFASGELRGEEFRSVMENIPDVAKRIADGLGVVITSLRGMAEQGELTTDRVVTALLSQTAAIDEEFSKLPRTVAEAWVQMKNDVVRELGRGSTAENATDGLVTAIDRMRASLSIAIPVIVQLISAGSNLAAMISENLDTIVALTSGYVAARVALKALNLMQLANLTTFSRSRIIVAGMSALLAGNYTKALQAATLGWRSLNAAMLANPAGIVAFAIGLGVSALVTWNLTTDTATEKTNALAAANEHLKNAMDEVAAASKGGAEALKAELAIEEAQIAAQGKLSENAAHALVNLQAQKKEIEAVYKVLRTAESGEKFKSPAFFEAAKELHQLNQEIGIYESQLKGANVISETAQKKIDAINLALAKLDAQGIATVNKKLLKHFEQLVKTLDPAAQRLKDMAKSQAALDAALADGQITRDQHALYMEKLNKELYPDADEFTRQYIVSLTEEAALIGLGNSERNIELAVRTKINEAKALGIKLTGDDIKEIRREIAALQEAKDEAEERRKAEEQAAKRLEQIYKNAAENIQRSLADAIYDGLNGSLSGIKGFFKKVVDIWKRSFAEKLAVQIFEQGQNGGGGGLFGLFGNLFPGSNSGVENAPGTGGGIFGALSEGINKLGGFINDFGAKLGFPSSTSALTAEGTQGAGGVAGLGGGPTTLLGSLGQGAGVGLLVNGILGGDSTGGAIGGALGSAIGNLFGPAGGLIGGLLGSGVGGFFSSIFGSKKPRAGTTLSIDADGNISNTTPRTYSSKADPGIATGLASLFSDQLTNLALTLGADLQSGLQLGEIGYRKDLFVFDPTANARIKDFGEPDNDRDTQTFETEEEAVRAALAHALSQGVITGVSDEVAAFLKRTTSENLDTVLSNLDFLSVYDDLATVTRDMSEAEKALDDLNQNFIDASKQAKKLGLAVDPLFDAWEQEIDRLREKFEESVQLGYLDLVDPARAELTRLRDEQINRLEEALALGADTALVQKLNAEEWSRAIESLDAQVNSLFNQFSNNLDSFLNDLSYGSASSLSPAEQLRQAEARFNTLASETRDGDEEAAQEIFEAARSLLDLWRDAVGSSPEYATRENFVRATLTSLQGQLPRTDVSAIAGDVGTAALTDQQVANITETIERGQTQMISLLGEIANNTSGQSTQTSTGINGLSGSNNLGFDIERINLAGLR